MKLFAFVLIMIAFQSQALSLKTVDSKVTDSGHSIEMTFDQDIKADQFSVDFINETVQINLPSVTLPKGTLKQDLSTNGVKSLYTYKVNKNLARTRVMFEKATDATKYQPNTQLVASGNTLTLKINTNASGVGAVTDEELKQASEWLAKADQADAAKAPEKAITTAVAATATITPVVTASNADKLPQKTEDNLKETEIPVLSATTQKVVEKKGGMTAKVLLSLGFVIALLFGFSIFAKKYFKKAPSNKNNQIKMLTQYYLGPRKSLAIVRVAGESILIGVTENNINLIKTLALMDEEIPQEVPPKDFSSALSNLFKKEKLEMQDEPQDEFSISKIKDAVNGKLKDMKEI